MKSELWWQKYNMAYKIEGVVVILLGIWSFMTKSPFVNIVLSFNMIVFMGLLGFEQHMRKGKKIMALGFYLVGAMTMLAFVSQLDIFLNGVR